MLLTWASYITFPEPVL